MHAVLFSPNSATSNLGTLKETENMNQNILKSTNEPTQPSPTREKEGRGLNSRSCKSACPSTEAGLLDVPHHFNTAQVSGGDWICTSGLLLLSSQKEDWLRRLMHPAAELSPPKDPSPLPALISHVPFPDCSVFSSSASQRPLNVRFKFQPDSWTWQINCGSHKSYIFFESFEWSLYKKLH